MAGDILDYSAETHRIEPHQVDAEMERIRRAFVQVDSYRTPEEREIAVSWIITARFHDYPEGWLKVYSEAGYTGDYYWTIINR